MSDATIGTCRVQVMKDDITSLDTDAFVFAARPDLALGAGFGSAIALRGGPSIQAELKTLAPVAVGQAVVTAAGKLKARHIVHVVGPRFQEADLPRKLAEATRSALAAAQSRGVRRLAIPPLGTGFYGIPLDLCARVMVAELVAHLAGGTGLQEVTICVRDTQELAPFERELRAATTTGTSQAPRAPTAGAGAEHGGARR